VLPSIDATNGNGTRTNHGSNQGHVRVATAEKLAPDFEENKGGTEANRGCFLKGHRTLVDTLNVRGNPRVVREAKMETPN
jgi:hypothetical protein